MENSACFIGHRKINDTPQLRKYINELLTRLIKDGVINFIFGDHSEFNSLCYEIVNFRKRFYRILKDAGIETKGLHSLRHTFATNLVNGVKQPDGTIKALSPKQVADLLGHTTSQITEMYYVKKDTSRLNGITDGFEI